MKLNADALSAHLSGPLAPVYLISGDEPLTAGEAADAVRSRAREQGFTERNVHFVTAGFSWPDLEGSISTLSLFAERRLLEVRLSSARPGVAGGAALVRLIESVPEDVRLLILAPRLERDVQSAQWVQAAQSRGVWVPVWPVDAQRLPGWLAARARRLGLSADAGVFEALAERTEGNLLAAHQELEKLRLAARDGRIRLEDVLGGVSDSARFDTFRLIDAARAGDAPRTLRILDGLRAEGFEPVLVLWGLVRAMRELAKEGRGGADPVRLARRAARADRIIKGRAAGDAWDEMALLAAEITERPVLALEAGGL